MSKMPRVKTEHRHLSSSAFQSSSDSRTAQELAASLCEQIASRADTCALIADSLDGPGRTKLLHALVASESSARGHSASTDSIFTSFDQQAPFNYLDRCVENNEAAP